MIHNVAEGRLYLEEEALLDLGEQLDLDTMVGTLVQVSLMEGIPVSVSCAVHAVALILTQMNMESGVANNKADTAFTPSVNAVASKLEAQAKVMQEVVLGKFGPRPIGTRSEPDQTPQSWSWSGIFPKTPDRLVPGLGIPILPETVSDPVWTGTI